MSRCYSYDYIKDILGDCHESVFDLLIDNNVVPIFSEHVDVSKFKKYWRDKEKRKILEFLRTHFGLKYTRFPRGQKNYWILRGYDEEYAEKKIKEFSNVYSTLSVESIMVRHSCSRTEAEKIFNYRVKRIKQAYANLAPEEKAKLARKKDVSLEGMISRYGVEEGTARYNSRIEKAKYSRSLDGLIAKYGDDRAREIFAKRNESKSSSYESLVKKYGESVAKEKYALQIERKAHAHTIQGYIDRYGFDEGTKRYVERQEKFKKSWSKIPKDELERIRKLQSCTLESFRKRYGDLKGTSMYVEARKKASSRASLESLRVFLPLYAELLNRGFLDDDILFGYGSKKEKYLHEDETFYYYDFCIESLKLIVEFNGLMFHPKTPDDTKWYHPFNPNITAEEKFKYDQVKNKFAEDNGYRVIIVWEDVDSASNLRYIMNIIDAVRTNDEAN